MCKGAQPELQNWTRRMKPSTSTQHLCGTSGMQTGQVQKLCCFGAITATPHVGSAKSSQPLKVSELCTSADPVDELCALTRDERIAGMAGWAATFLYDSVNDHRCAVGCRAINFGIVFFFIQLELQIGTSWLKSVRCIPHG